MTRHSVTRARIEALEGLTREELEAVIWRWWPARGPGAARAVDAILGAADQYATHTGSITAERRAALRNARAARDVHYLAPDLSLACGHRGRDASSSVLAEVTCSPCKAVTPC
jgi:hypothetical protein